MRITMSSVKPTSSVCSVASMVPGSAALPAEGLTTLKPGDLVRVIPDAEQNPGVPARAVPASSSAGGGDTGNAAVAHEIGVRQ